tara:strand:- start:43 stop:387 length:345 start_codon:yes stop_codon:yes gene_type:complete
MRRPFYKEHKAVFEIDKDVSKLEFFVPEKWQMQPVKYEGSKNGEFLLLVKGFAPPYTTHYLSYSIEKVEDLIKVHFKESVDGYHRKTRHTFELKLPKKLKGHTKFNDYITTSAD